MISPLALALAVAFWQPYSAEPVCPQGVHVQVHEIPAIKRNGILYWVNGQSYMSAKDCQIQVNIDFPEWSVARQCQLIAHELGHNVFGLPDQDTDPKNIMYFEERPAPGACKPPRPKALRRARQA